MALASVDDMLGLGVLGPLGRGRWPWVYGVGLAAFIAWLAARRLWDRRGSRHGLAAARRSAAVDRGVRPELFALATEAKVVAAVARRAPGSSAPAWHPRRDSPAGRGGRALSRSAPGAAGPSSYRLLGAGRCLQGGKVVRLR